MNVIPVAPCSRSSILTGRTLGQRLVRVSHQTAMQVFPVSWKHWYENLEINGYADLMKATQNALSESSVACEK
jgi:hypothetical protein